MYESTNASVPLLRAARAAAEAFLAALDQEGLTRAPERQSMPARPEGPAQGSAAGLTAYDPLTDEPPFAPDPSPSAPPAAQRMASLTYLGAVARINASEGRGATSKEITKFAKKAGYTDGKSVNGWNSRPNSPRAIENIDGARYLNAATHAWLFELAHELGITIKGDTTPLPLPE